MAVMRRHSRRLLAGSLLTIATLTLGGCSDDRSHSFDPLAQAKISAVGHHDEFDAMVWSFVDDHHLIIQAGNFPRKGRTVIDVTVSIDQSEQTFILITDLRSEYVFDVICYSHEAEAKWMSMWDDFIKLARDRLGSENVEILKREPIKTEEP